MEIRLLAIGTATLLALASSSAVAAEPGTSPEASSASAESPQPETSEPEDESADPEDESADPEDESTEPEDESTEPTSSGDWIHRWAPAANMTETGPFVGVLFPSPRIELFEADQSLPDQGYKPYASVAPDFGIRAAFLPLRFFGVEGEVGIMPARTTAGDSALMWTARAHVVGQLGLWSVTPFVLAGAGLIGVASERSSVGSDVDASAHFGVGVKVFLNRLVALRLDARDIIAARRGYEAGVIHNPEILLGVSFALRRR